MATVSATPAVAVRKIGQEDLRWALAEGWNDFNEKRGDLIFVAFLYPLIGLIAALFAFNSAALPMLFPLVAGLSILGPAVASGFYELARRREEGLESDWRHFFDPVTGPSRSALAVLTACLAVIFLLWLVFAFAIYAAMLGPDFPVGVGDFLTRVFTTPQGWGMIILGNLTGLVFAILTLAVSVVSFPMVVDRPVDPGIALETSVRAARANPQAMTAWGIKVAGLLFLGCLPAFIGLAVALPVLGYATWHLYTRLVERVPHG